MTTTTPAPYTQLSPDRAKGPTVLRVIYVNVEAMRSKGGGLVAMPIHEVPLARVRHAMVGEPVDIQTDWIVGGSPRVQDWDKDDYEKERQRLTRVYGAVSHGEKVHDLLSPIYGAECRELAKAMRAVGDEYARIVKVTGDEPASVREWESLVRLADNSIADLPELEPLADAKPAQASADDEGNLDAAVLDALTSRGIGPRKAREVAALAARAPGIPALEDLAVIFGGNVEKAKTARAGLEAVTAGVR
jgi:hypothetical protein